MSGPLAVSMGMPQGSNLGQTLFSVYINDVALAVGDSLIHLYADDSILYTAGPSLDTHNFLWYSGRLRPTWPKTRENAARKFK